MTIAYWCVLGMILFPMIFTALAKTRGDYTHKDPRVYFARLDGWRKRAYWVELNIYESFPPFAAAVIIAQQLHAFQPTVDKLAIGFVVARVLHSLCYIGNQGVLRTLFWMLGFACVIALFVISA